MTKQDRRFQSSHRMAFVASFALGVSLAACGGDSGGGAGGTVGTGGRTGAGGSIGADAPVIVNQDAAPVPGTGGTIVTIADSGATGGTTGSDARDVSTGGRPEVGTDASLSTGGAGGTVALDGGPIDAAPVNDVPPFDTTPAGQVCRSPKSAFRYDVNLMSGGAWTSDGQVVVGTRIFGNVPFDFGGKQVVSNGSADMLLAKLNPGTGAATWVLTAGDAKDQAVTSVASTSVGIAATGFFKGTLDIANGSGAVAPLVNPSSSTNYAFLAGVKSSDGTPVWAKSANLGTGAISQVAGNSNKNYFLVCGSTSAAGALGAVGTPAGGKDVLVAAVKADDGSVLWAKTFGTSLDEECTRVAMDDSGNAIFGGYYLGALDLGQGPFPAASATNGVKLMWVAKFDAATGSVVAAKAFGTAGLEMVNGLATNAQGDVAVVGQITKDITFGARTLVVKSAGDAFVVKLSGTDLTPVWARRWGDQQTGSNGASAATAAFDSTGALTVAGQFGGSIDIGGALAVDAGAPGVITSVSSSDLFIATLNGAAGETACVRTFGDATPTATAAAVAFLIDRAPAAGGGDRVALLGAFQKVLDFGSPTTPMSASIAGFLLGM